MSEEVKLVSSTYGIQGRGRGPWVVATSKGSRAAKSSLQFLSDRLVSHLLNKNVLAAVPLLKELVRHFQLAPLLCFRALNAVVDAFPPESVRHLSMVRAMIDLNVSRNKDKHVHAIFALELSFVLACLAGDTQAAYDNLIAYSVQRKYRNVFAVHAYCGIFAADLLRKSREKHAILWDSSKNEAHREAKRYLFHRSNALRHFAKSLEIKPDSFAVLQALSRCVHGVPLKGMTYQATVLTISVQAANFWKDMEHTFMVSSVAHKPSKRKRRKNKRTRKRKLSQMNSSSSDDDSSDEGESSTEPVDMLRQYLHLFVQNHPAHGPAQKLKLDFLLQYETLNYSEQLRCALQTLAIDATYQNGLEVVLACAERGNIDTLDMINVFGARLDTLPACVRSWSGLKVHLVKLLETFDTTDSNGIELDSQAIIKCIRRFQWWSRSTSHFRRVILAKRNKVGISPHTPAANGDIAEAKQRTIQKLQAKCFLIYSNVVQILMNI